jgi:hypothetical protein
MRFIELSALVLSLGFLAKVAHPVVIRLIKVENFRTNFSSCEIGEACTTPHLICNIRTSHRLWDSLRVVFEMFPRVPELLPACYQ